MHIEECCPHITDILCVCVCNIYEDLLIKMQYKISDFYITVSISSKQLGIVSVLVVCPEHHFPAAPHGIYCTGDVMDSKNLHVKANAQEQRWQN